MNTQVSSTVLFHKTPDIKHHHTAERTMVKTVWCWPRQPAMCKESMWWLLGEKRPLPCKSFLTEDASPTSTCWDVWKPLAISACTVSFFPTLSRFSSSLIHWFGFSITTLLHLSHYLSRVLCFLLDTVCFAQLVSAVPDASRTSCHVLFRLLRVGKLRGPLGWTHSSSL